MLLPLFSLVQSVMSDSAIPRTAACQTSLSITSSRSLFVSIESVMPSIIKQNYHMTEQFHIWVYPQKNWKQRHTLVCSCQDHSLQPKGGNHTQVHLQMSGSKKGDVYVQWISWHLKKERNPDTCYSIGECGTCKLTEIVFDSPYMRYTRWSKPRHGK